MNDMNENKILQIIKQRRSVRSYAEKQVSESDIATILEAGLYAHNGGGNIGEDVFFTVIQNKELLRKINFLSKEAAKKSPLAWLRDLGRNEQYDGLYDAPVLIIVSYTENAPSAAFDCSAITQNMLLAAESLGLGSCWLYFPLQAFEYDKNGALAEELQIPVDYKPVTSFILGYKTDSSIVIPERKTDHVCHIR
jgi:nitroreductase